MSARFLGIGALCLALMPQTSAATIGFSSPCQQLNQKLVGGTGTGVESELYLDANMLQNHITTLDGTLTPLFSHKGREITDRARAITGDDSFTSLLARDWASGTTAEQKHALLSLSMEGVKFSNDYLVIPGIKLKTSVRVHLKEPTEIFGNKLPAGSQWINLSPFLSETIEVADPNQPLPLRHVEIHHRAPLEAGVTLRSIMAIEQALGWQVGARHVHMIAEFPMDTFAEKTPMGQVMQTGFALTEILRVGSLAIEMLAVTKANDSLDHLYYFYNKAAREKISFGGVYRDEHFLHMLDTALLPQVSDQDTIGFLKLGTIAYKPRGKYKDPKLHGFELRIVHPESTEVVSQIISLLHHALIELDPNKLLQTPHFVNRASFRWLKETLDALQKNDHFPKYYMKSAVYNREWDDLLKDLPVRLRPYRRALQRLEQATIDEHGIASKDMQIKWLVHDWRRDPILAVVEKESLNYIVLEQERYLKRLEEDETLEPRDAAREFAATSNLAKLFLGMFGVNYEDLPK